MDRHKDNNPARNPNKRGPTGLKIDNLLVNQHPAAPPLKATQRQPLRLPRLPPNLPDLLARRQHKSKTSKATQIQSNLLRHHELSSNDY